MLQRRPDLARRGTLAEDNRPVPRGQSGWQVPPSILASTTPAHLAQQAAFEVGAPAARIRDEAPWVLSQRPGQHLQLQSRRGTQRRPGPGWGCGRSGSTWEGARGQDAGSQLHVESPSQRGPGFFSVPPGRGRARRCRDLLCCARARGSPAFLSMKACPLSGVSSLRARPLPGGESPRSHAPPQALRHREAPPPTQLTSRPSLLLMP